MNKKAEIETNTLFSLTLGAVFALAGVILVHMGSPWGILVAIIAVIIWIFNFSAAMAISGILLIAGFVELYNKKIGLAITWLVIAVVAFIFRNMARE